MTVRRVWVRVHQYTGLAAALFLVVIGLSGSVLAFEPDYDRWFNPALWHVSGAEASATRRLSEQALADTVQSRFGDSTAGVRIAQIDIAADARIVQVFEMTNGRRVYLDPFTARVTGSRRGRTALERFLFDVRLLHTRLFVGEHGRQAVDVISTLLVVLIVPIGFYLWLNKRRAKVAWRASWRRANWDLHSVVGIYAAAFLLTLGATGVFIGYEPALYWLTRSAPEPGPRLPHSVVRTADDSNKNALVTLDHVLAAADSALPRATMFAIILPMRAQSVFQVLKRQGPGRSMVAVDRYSGRVLLVDDYAKAPAALRAHTIDQSVHLGTIGGMGSAVAAALSGLALVLIVLTGTLIWWRPARWEPDYRSDRAP